MPDQFNKATPEVYVFDGEGASGRNWSFLVPRNRTLTWIRGVGGKAGAFSPERPSSGSIVICHQPPNDALKDLPKLAEEGVHIVRISLAQGDGLLSDRTYARKKPVRKTPDDLLFATCFALFRRDLEKSGRPNWEHLEGAVPENILAYHLCGLLEEADAQRLRDELREGARMEGQVLAQLGHGDWAHTILDSAVQLREFLKKHA